GDELYFIICGQHPQWNYVDQPPVAPLLAPASQAFGPSLVLLRAWPAFLWQVHYGYPMLELLCVLASMLRTSS
ncbi:MAG: hypothetical protein P4M04_05370, partial [Acidobacteriota bacterium]|nr:hypothetical protein [Acidobacteriota bacterium]